MRTTFAAGAVCLACSGAMSASAHVSQSGEACHMGPAPMSSGTVVEQWHCHKGPDVEALERHRKQQCAKRLAKLRRAIEQLDNPYARKVLAKKCSDRSSKVGKHICAGAEKQYRANLKGRQSYVEWRRAKAAQICRPGEMI